MLLGSVCSIRFIPACAGNSGSASSSTSATPVHPRVCGELRIRFILASMAAGSSPRVRGTPGPVPQPVHRRRFIPACAGNSREQALVRGGGPVHPRVCGELGCWHWPDSAHAGSSPRVRGTPGRPAPAPRSGRFIPACAGNSARRSTTPSSRSVHPRVCGELTRTWSAACSGVGSSPRVRGTLGGPERTWPPRRFIPACAGNSPCTRPPRRRRAVHPRVCGELAPREPALSAVDGSSPRVRGTRFPTGGTDDRTRFIPACAGNSPEWLRWRPPGDGSSPRVRGTPPGAGGAPRQGRFIPACAGNSISPEPRGPRASVHPRVCGELLERAGQPAADRRFIPACAGNSTPPSKTPASQPVHPRVCGELVHHRGEQIRGLRFIPACAGNSSRSAARSSPPSVHPRVCGELLSVVGAASRTGGSSPRVRGTRNVAGREVRALPVHPRVCGELRLALTDDLALRGSSPRVRGTRLSRGRTGPGARFIPACAGNSRPRVPCLGAWTVHPRVCGELEELRVEETTVDGSSPRVRGTRKRARGSRTRRRFIPACAGNSGRRPDPPG